MSFRPGITELIAVAFGRFGRPLGASLDVVNIVDLIHEETFGFHDNGDRLQRSNVLESHRHRPGNRFAHHHVDLGLSRKETQDLSDIVTLKLAHAHPATFCDGQARRQLFAKPLGFRPQSPQAVPGRRWRSVAPAPATLAQASRARAPHCARPRCCQ